MRGDKLKKYYVVLCSLGFFLTLVLLSSPTYAEECSPFQFSLWPSIQLVPKEKVVCGVRLDLVAGDNAEVSGLDAGLANFAGAFKGLQIGVVNWLGKKDGRVSCGVRIGGLDVDNNMTGVQVGLGSIAINMTGMQISMFENDAVQMRGVQIALFANSAMQGDVNISGVQIAIANADYGHMTGVQIGIVNVCKYLTGVQIGLINIVYGGEKAIPFMPLLNIGFY